MAGYPVVPEQQDYVHQNMARSGDSMHEWNAGYNGNIHMPTPYAPVTPSLQLNGMDMQLHHGPRTAQIPDLQQMERYLLDMQMSHASDRVRLERSTRHNAKEIAKLRDEVRGELQILKSRLDCLQEADADAGIVTFNPEDNRVALEDAIQSILISGDLSPATEMLNRWGRERVAEAYRTTVGDQELVAKMRAVAQQITDGVDPKDMTQTRLLEAPPTPGSKVIGFACCETAYGDVKELLAHVKEAHPEAVQPRLASDAGTQCTPTHVPAPHLRRSKSRAVEIKAPTASSPAKGCELLSRLVEKNLALQPQEEAAAKCLPLAEKNLAHGAQEQAAVKWVPLAVSQMPERSAKIPANTATFSFQFLRGCLEGKEWSSGFYYDRHAFDPATKKRGMAYWLLDPEHEPYLPEAPGKHGAKLTAFFNDTSNNHAPGEDQYENCPVFIKEKNSNQYRYFGMYSQTRYSDKVDYDHLMTQIPDHVRHYWANELGREGRPQWVTDKLVNHYWPRPTYDGPTPTGSAVSTPATLATGLDSAGGLEKKVARALADYADDLKAWKKDTDVKMKFLKPEHIYKSFADPDSDIPPGMRLWWEYFEFQEFNIEFHDSLVRLSKTSRFAGAPGKSGAKRPPTPPIRGTRSTEMKTGVLDDEEERWFGALMPTKAGTKAIEDVKPTLKTGNDVAAAVVTPGKVGMEKQAALDPDLQKSGPEQKQCDTQHAPASPLSSVPEDTPASPLSSVPEESLDSLGPWLLEDSDAESDHYPNAPGIKTPEPEPEPAETVARASSPKPIEPKIQKSEVKPELQDSNEGNKPVPTWNGGGDLNAAKQLNEELKKGTPARGGKRVAPHLRRK